MAWVSDTRDPVDLRRRLPAELADRLLQRVHAVHAAVRVVEAAAARVHRQRTADRGVTLGDERAGLAARHEAEVLERHQREDARRRRTASRGRRRTGASPAAANAAAPARRNASDDVRSGIWLAIAAPLASPLPSTCTGGRGRSRARSADVTTIAPPASVVTQHIGRVKGYATTRRVEHLVDGDGIAAQRPRVAGRPVALRDDDLRERRSGRGRGRGGSAACRA